MSDVSQGPGWWQASDGKWYAPQPPGAAAPAPAAPTPPMDAKSAKAAAKSAQAHAKALRPWYKKKRIILSGLVVLLIVVIVAASSGSKKSTNAATPTGDSTTATAAAGDKAANGCTANPPAYPDKQSTDCVALPDNSVAMANTKVTAVWTKSQNSIGDNLICAAVTIKNINTSTISYNEYYWKLQSPTGTVVNSTFTLDNQLNSGDLVGGGTASGNVCFTDPGTPGTYIGIYKPDPFNATRGIWLFPLT